MKHRSDKFLRQDLLFCCIFSILVDQTLESNLPSIDDLFKMRNDDKEFTKTMLQFWRIKKEVKSESLELKQIAKEWLVDIGANYISQFTLEDKYYKFHKLMKSSFDDIGNVIFKNNNLFKPDKLILIVYSLAEEINNGFFLLPFQERIINFFLQVERFFNAKKDLKDWELIKKSAEKQAKRILVDFQEKGYFKLK